MHNNRPHLRTLSHRIVFLHAGTDGFNATLFVWDFFFSFFLPKREQSLFTNRLTIFFVFRDIYFDFFSLTGETFFLGSD
jgi:hypothetical protein